MNICQKIKWLLYIQIIKRLEITYLLGSPTTKGRTLVLLFQGWHGRCTRVLECHIGCHVYFIDPEQYISSPSSKLACRQKRLYGVKDCLMSEVVVLTSMGWWVCLAPKHGQVFSGVKSDNIDKVWELQVYEAC